MPEKELEDYVKVQRTLGVSDAAIRKSLVSAGYEENDFKEIFEKHARKPLAMNITTKHTLYLNIATIIFVGMMFLYLTNDYNQKITNLTAQQQNDMVSLNSTIKAQSDILGAKITSQSNTLSTAIDKAKTESTASINDLSASIQNNNYQSMSRDTALSNSLQSMSNKSLTQLTSFQQQLTTVEKASADFTKVIPKAVNTVVIIGRKEQGYFVTSGSGVIINKEGYIVTNYHVVDQLSDINVKTHAGNDYSATLVGKDEKWDIAVLKLASDKNDFDSLDWADSDKAYVGEHVIAIGNPVGLDSTVTEGIISNIKRQVTADTDIHYLQTDVAINAGNSGGPLIDKDGKILGIATMKYAEAGFEGLSFALRSNDIRGVVLKILQGE